MKDSKSGDWFYLRMDWFLATYMCHKLKISWEIVACSDLFFTFSFLKPQSKVFEKERYFPNENRFTISGMSLTFFVLLNRLLILKNQFWLLFILAPRKYHCWIFACTWAQISDSQCLECYITQQYSFTAHYEKKFTKNI